MAPRAGQGGSSRRRAGRRLRRLGVSAGKGDGCGGPDTRYEYLQWSELSKAARWVDLIFRNKESGAAHDAFPRTGTADPKPPEVLARYDRHVCRMGAELRQSLNRSSFFQNYKALISLAEQGGSGKRQKAFGLINCNIRGAAPHPTTSPGRPASNICRRAS